MATLAMMLVTKSRWMPVKPIVMKFRIIVKASGIAPSKPATGDLNETAMITKTMKIENKMLVIWLEMTMSVIETSISPFPVGTKVYPAGKLALA